MMCPTCGFTTTVKQMVGFDDAKLAEWKSTLVAKLGEVIPAGVQQKVALINKLVDGPVGSAGIDGITDPSGMKVMQASTAFAKAAAEGLAGLLPTGTLDSQGEVIPDTFIESAVQSVGELLATIGGADTTSVLSKLGLICGAAGTDAQCAHVLTPLTGGNPITDSKSGHFTMEKYFSSAKALATIIKTRAAADSPADVAGLMSVLGTILDEHTPELQANNRLLTCVGTTAASAGRRLVEGGGTGYGGYEIPSEDPTNPTTGPCPTGAHRSDTLYSTVNWSM
jgi:hypothetical protein